MDRVIMHADIDHCYAQIEEMKDPRLRDIPMAVGGDTEKRHGIILAKNDLAKACGIITGESIPEAMKKCPRLKVLHPVYGDYVFYTEMVKDIYRRYSDRVESFGLDEAWVDLSASRRLFGDPVKTAEEIQQTVLLETGLTVSVGLSWNKIFAKLGSDMHKPFGMTVITKENFRDVVWPCRVSDLLYVGKASARRLACLGIHTIGDLAVYPLPLLKAYLGRNGELLHRFANGEEAEPVKASGTHRTVKSVGNSVTMIRDVHDIEALRPIIRVISEAVAARLSEQGLEGSVITVFLRNADLLWMSRQRKLADYTAVSDGIFAEALSLTQQNYDFSVPMRSFGITVSGLRQCASHHQLSLFQDPDAYEKSARIDQAMEMIRGKYGFRAVCRAVTKMDEELTDFDPKGEHMIHPEGYFTGRRMNDESL